MNGEITYKIYDFKNEIPPDFFKWCLNNNLYKKTKNPDFNSRVKMMYNGEMELKGLTSIIAFQDENPVAIIHCEHDNEFHKAYLLKNIFKIKSIKSKEYDWGYHHMGMVSMYVKKKYRKKGIATQLWNKLEIYRLHTLKENKEYQPLSVPIFTARELAFEIIDKKAEFSYVTDKQKQYTNYKSDIHTLTNAILEHRDNDPYPMEKIRIRKSLDFSSFPIMEEKITTFTLPPKIKL